MKAKKNYKVGDIFFNPLARDLWFLNKCYYEDDKKDKWTLNLIHTDYRVELAEVDRFIKIGNIYEILGRIDNAIEMIMNNTTLDKKLKKELINTLRGEK